MESNLNWSVIIQSSDMNRIVLLLMKVTISENSQAMKEREICL